ncbi:MAG: AAA family ATPase [Actinomycetota bacterium]
MPGPVLGFVADGTEHAARPVVGTEAVSHRRIAIVGSFSTGKTMLAEALARQLELPLLPETAREVVSLGFKLDKDATPETETLIFLKQYNNEISTPEFVGDRSLVDALAYAEWVLAHKPHRKEMALWDECRRLAERRLRSNYSHVFYLPIEFPIVLDGLRPDDPEFQREIDERILGILASHDIPYWTLKGSVAERLAQIHSTLRSRDAG